MTDCTALGDREVEVLHSSVSHSLFISSFIMSGNQTYKFRLLPVIKAVKKSRISHSMSTRSSSKKAASASSSTSSSSSSSTAKRPASSSIDDEKPQRLPPRKQLATIDERPKKVKLATRKEMVLALSQSSSSSSAAAPKLNAKAKKELKDRIEALKYEEKNIIKEKKRLTDFNIDDTEDISYSPEKNDYNVALHEKMLRYLCCEGVVNALLLKQHLMKKYRPSIEVVYVNHMLKLLTICDVLIQPVFQYLEQNKYSPVILLLDQIRRKAFEIQWILGQKLTKYQELEAWNSLDGSCESIIEKFDFTNFNIPDEFQSEGYGSGSVQHGNLKFGFDEGIENDIEDGIPLNNVRNPINKLGLATEYSSDFTSDGSDDDYSSPSDSD